MKKGSGKPFWTRIAIGSYDDCWPWMGARLVAGYGVFGKISAHREAYRRAYGSVPVGMMVLHHCDNPPCCNPAHLFIGTARDNIMDAMAKGRAKGPKVPPWPNNPNQKLNPAKATQIRELRAAGRGVRELGKLFGVSHSSIQRILEGKTYQHG